MVFIINNYFRYKPGTADELLQAFHTLDTESKGSLSVDFMQQALREGDSLDPDDITEAIKTAYDPDFQCIYYDIWIHKLMVSLVTATVSRFKIVNGHSLNSDFIIHHRLINHNAIVILRRK